MKPASAKAKGRKFQQQVRDAILEAFPQLEKDDVRSTSMGAGGTDIQLSPAAKRLFGFSVECKSIGRFAGYGFYDQAVAHSQSGDTTIPIAAVKANGREPLVIISLKDFLEIVKNGRN
jgi:hypothetical protein